MTKASYLSVLGDPNDIRTLSGLPYYLLQEGLAQGVLAGGVHLRNQGPAMSLGRCAWNLAQAATGGGRGGYQYSTAYLEWAWAPHRRALRGTRVISLFQLCAPTVVRDPDIEKWFFVDLSLRQLFDDYGYRQGIGRRVARNALRGEIEGYAGAAGVIAASDYVADSLASDAGVPRACIHVVRFGAGFDRAHYAAWEREAASARSAAGDAAGSLRLVTVAEYWHRKGVDRLLGALALARRQGSRMTLRIIGCRREELPEPLRDVPGVEWLGFVSKIPDPLRYMRLVSACDLGCLFSRAEATGLVVREYQALGLVVAGTDAGGAADFHFPDSTVLIRTTDDDETIAGKLLALERDPARFAQMRRAAWQHRQQALWGSAVRQLAALWS